MQFHGLGYDRRHSPVAGIPIWQGIPHIAKRSRYRKMIRAYVRQPLHFDQVKTAVDENVVERPAHQGKLGVEGIMAKRIDAKYVSGKRSDAWVKVKVKENKDCVIIGFTKGEGEREKYFGSLHLAEEIDGQFLYRGRVGTGFDERLLKSLTKQFKNLVQTERRLEQEVHEEEKIVWLGPSLHCEIEYSMITENGTFRDAVFKKLIEE